MGEFVRLEVEDRVGTIRLDRPKMNAINDALVRDLAAAAQEATERDDVGAVVLWGGERIFAAGADVKLMADMNPITIKTLITGMQDVYAMVEEIPKVTIAAINGYALGGGCELAMLCDVIVAAENARFGQPEINIGLIPGAGGTQRLTRSVGKYVASDMVLTGRMLGAEEAFQRGLVARVVPQELVVDAAVKLGKEIATKAPISVRLAREAITRAFEGRVDDGIEFERKLFYLLFATQDAHEGMHAFNEKRQPTYEGR
jgi:enoyl-CoA hydratase